LSCPPVVVCCIDYMLRDYLGILLPLRRPTLPWVRLELNNRLSIYAYKYERLAASPWGREMISSHFEDFTFSFITHIYIITSFYSLPFYKSDFLRKKVNFMFAHTRYLTSVTKRVSVGQYLVIGYALLTPQTRKLHTYSAHQGDRFKRFNS
jgi:hypothetical protein